MNNKKGRWESMREDLAFKVFYSAGGIVGALVGILLGISYVVKYMRPEPVVIVTGGFLAIIICGFVGYWIGIVIGVILGQILQETLLNPPYLKTYFISALPTVFLCAIIGSGLVAYSLGMSQAFEGAKTGAVIGLVLNLFVAGRMKKRAAKEE